MISFSHVTKKYENEDGKVLVYEDFSEEIGKGEFVVLTGESGSGKTTLIKMLLKETEPDSGTIFVDGKDISKIGRKDIPFYRRSIGVLFQDFRLIQESSVYDNLSQQSWPQEVRTRKRKRRSWMSLQCWG